MLVKPLLAPLFALSSSLSLAHESTLSCHAPLAEREIYIALSSLERGYAYPDTTIFRQEMEKLVTQRAMQICKNRGCGAAKSYVTREYAQKGILHARIPEQDELVLEEFRMSRRWEYGGRTYHYLGNLMWYFGHCLSAVSTSFAIASRNNHMEATTAVYTGLGFAIGGQIITMLSRYVERAEPRVVDIETALQRKADGSPITPVFVADVTLVPHLRFSELQCGPSPAEVP